MADETRRGGRYPDGDGPGRAPVHESRGVDGHATRSGQPAVAVLGAFSLVGGLTWALLNLQSPRPVLDIVVGVVLAAGGLVLLMPHRVRLPARSAWAAAGAVAVAGCAGGLAVGTSVLGGMYSYVERRGFPFQWLTRGGVVADDPDTARRLAAADAWQVDVLPLAADAVVWAYAGLLAFVLVRRLRPGR